MSEEEKILPLHPALQSHFMTKFTPLFSQWIKQERVPQSILITGAHGSGKHSCAHFISQTLMCLSNSFAKKTETEEGFSFFNEPNTSLSNKPHEILPCGNCKSCQRALRNQWIDLEEIKPEKSDVSKSGTIKVDALRNLKSTQGHSALECSYRVVLIQNAETMTTQASNSLLKILEEPPEGWIFILTTTDATLLLPTILSRCQNIKLPPLNNKVFSEIVGDTKISPENQELLIYLSQGSLKKFKDMLNPQFLENRKKLISFFKSPELYFNELIDLAAKNNQDFIQLIDQLDLICSDFILMHASSNSSLRPLHNKDFVDFITSTSKNFDDIRPKVFDLLENQQEIRSRLHLPLNKKLLAQSLLTPWINIILNKSNALEQVNENYA